MSTPRSLRRSKLVTPTIIETPRGSFAALAAEPARGVDERQPALLVPGYTGSKEDFLAVLEPLAAGGRRVVAIDMRGQYESAPARGSAGYARQELADDLLAVAEVVSGGSWGAAPPGQHGGGIRGVVPPGQHGGGIRGVVPPGQHGGGSWSVATPAGQHNESVGRVHVVGHSFGGIMAREAAITAPTAFASLTLLGSGPGTIAGERAEALRDVLDFLRPAGDDPDALAGMIGQVWQAQLEPQARAEGTAPDIIDFLRERMLRNCPVGLVEMARHLLDCPDRTCDLAAIARWPILVSYGENDDAWPPDTQDAMAKRLDAERICIPGAAHSPAVEAPETTSAMLTAFWNQAEWGQ